MGKNSNRSFPERGLSMNKKPFFATLCICLFTFFTFTALGGYQKEPKAEFNPTMIVAAFRDLNVGETDCRLEALGQLEAGGMSQRGKEELLTKFAGDLGIESGYQLVSSSESGKARTDLIMDGKNGSTMISLITEIESGKNYFTLKIDFPKLSEPALSFKERVEAGMKKYKITGSVTAELYGRLPGVLSLDERESLAMRFFEGLGAKICVSKEIEKSYTVYGYTREIGDYILTEYGRINLNFAISYHELEDKTEVYLGIPILRSDY